MQKAKAARALVILGCIVLLANAALHCIEGYLHLSVALGQSNLAASLKPGLGSVFFLAGWNRIAIATIALIAAFSGAQGDSYFLRCRSVRFRGNRLSFCGLAYR